MYIREATLNRAASIVVSATEERLQGSQLAALSSLHHHMASVAEKIQQQHLPKEKKDKKVEALTVEDAKTLGHQLLSSRAHINNLPILLSILSPSSHSELVLESLISVQSFFLPLLPEIPSSSYVSKQTGTEQDPEEFYRSWLRARFNEYVNLLIEIAVSSTSAEAIKDVALDAIMDIVKQGRQGRFQSAIYHKFLQSIAKDNFAVCSGRVCVTASTGPLLDLIASKYFEYMDVRYFTYTSMGKISKDCKSTAITKDIKFNSRNFGEDQETESRLEVSSRTIYSILSCIPPLEEVDKEENYQMWSQQGGFCGITDEGKMIPKVSDSEANPLESKVRSTRGLIRKFKLRFTKAWLSFLKLSLPLDVYKEVLATLHQNVIPYLSNPAILCDFLTRSYDIGGVISVMALSGLFILMTKHGLEYPKFYEKLYALLKPSVFMAKHRAVFFQLLDTCLKSAYLPAYLAAAFAKKLSRLALSVPPSGELVIIALTHNLLRRHPSINFLVNQQISVDVMEGEDAAEYDESNEHARESNIYPSQHSGNNGVDVFDNDEIDPLRSNAMRSSLWEIDTLRSHYCPAVSRFVASLENDLTKRAKTYEMAIPDFSSGSYTTIFREEVRRRIKQCPVAFYRSTPTSLFDGSDFPGWTFETQQLDEANEHINEKVPRTLENHEHDFKRQRIESC